MSHVFTIGCIYDRLTKSEPRFFQIEPSNTDRTDVSGRAAARMATYITCFAA